MKRINLGARFFVESTFLLHIAVEKILLINWRAGNVSRI